MRIKGKLICNCDGAVGHSDKCLERAWRAGHKAKDETKIDTKTLRELIRANKAVLGSTKSILEFEKSLNVVERVWEKFSKEKNFAELIGR